MLERESGQGEANTPAELNDKALQHEEMAHEKRHWVRVTSACNNRCMFCLDASGHDGTNLPEDIVEQEILRGRKEGAQRLILSGGEASIHPSFLRFVKLGRAAGYSHIQTVTNGRMFSYPAFLKKCIVAGLREITFSIHGPDSKIHDALVGVPGAYEQAIKGLRMAIRSGRIIANVDVCLNRVNIQHLPRMLDDLIALGVHEFDLLHVIPFGRAFEKGRDGLGYDVDEARPYLQHALELSRRPDLHIWFNRFPPPYLEGFEHLIQDPHKLHDEVRGRQEELEQYLAEGTPLRCREPIRCQRCYLEDFCDRLEDTRQRVLDNRFDAYRITLTQGERVAALPLPVSQVWLVAPDAHTAQRAAGDLRCERLILELSDYGQLAGLLEQGRLAGKEISRAYADSPRSLDQLLSLEASFEVTAYLSREVAAHLQQAYPQPPPRLALSRRNHAKASESAQWDADLPAFFASYPAGPEVEEIPACISGRPPRAPIRLFDAASVNPAAGGQGADLIDLHGITEHYVREAFYSKSLRCRECRDNDTCRGVQLNYLRAHGYALLEPLSP